jgi:huntingtin-interacting protein 1-related protein
MLNDFVDCSKYLILWRRIAGTESVGALEPLKQRYNSQHYALLRFYYECSNLRYLTSLISVPKLPQVNFMHAVLPLT